MKKSILLLLLPILFASCAIHSGMMTGNASLGDNNFEMIGVAVGQARASYVFGIGGLSQRAIVLRAKRNLYSSFPLKKGQAYANVSVDFRLLNLLVFMRNTCTITADIVDYSNANQGDGNQIIFGDMQSLPADSLIDSGRFPFSRNQTVNLLAKNMKFRPGKVVEIWAFDQNITYVLLFADGKEPQYLEAKERDIFLTGQNDSLPSHNLQPGNVVEGNLKVPIAHTGIIIAIGTEYIIVQPAARAGLQKIRPIDVLLAK